MYLYGNAPGRAVEAATITMTTLAAMFVGLRLYARLGVAKNGGWDDGVIFGGLMFSVATTITMIVQVQKGMGRHQWEIDAQDAMVGLKAFWVMVIMYNMSLTCTKVSILIQYLRIFPQKPIRVATWTVMGVVVVYAVWRFFSAVFTCWPVNAFWDHSIEPQKCQDRRALSLASTSLNMSTDIAIAILPLPFLNNLQLPRRQKYALMAVFSLAGFVVIISILRLPSLYTLMSSKDTSYYHPMASIWSTIEINTGIICSCLPTLRCLFPHIFSAISSSSAAGNNRYDFFSSSRSAGTGTHTSYSSSTRKKGGAALHSYDSTDDNNNNSSTRKSPGYDKAPPTSSSSSSKLNTSIVSTPLPTHKKHRRWGSRDGGSFSGAFCGVRGNRNLLTPVEEIELGARKRDVMEQHNIHGMYAELPGEDVVCSNRIYVQTEIKQTESRGDEGGRVP